MSLSTLCDVIWAEIWDDCPALGDQTQYREIMVKLFIDGEDPANITWTDAEGKKHRLSKRRSGSTLTPQMVAQAKELRDRLKGKPKPADQVASPGDG